MNWFFLGSLAMIAAGRGRRWLPDGCGRLAAAAVLIAAAAVWHAGAEAGTPPRPAAIRILVVETEAEARDALAQIRAGVPFEQIVREQSIGPQRERGGYLGRVDPASLSPAVRAMLAKTRRGRVSGHFRTEEGYALIQVLTERDELEQEALLRRDPEALELFEKGTQRGKEGDLTGAVTLLRRALELNPSLGDARFNLGIALWKLGRAEEAIAIMREAVRINPQDLDAHLRLGAWLLSRGRTVEAVPHYERAATLQMESREIWLKLAQCYEAVGRFRAAGTAYRRVLGLLEQDDPAVVESLLRVALLAPDGPLAVEAARRLRAFRPGHEGLLAIGEALLVNGEVEAAVREFQMAVALAPTAAPAHAGLAKAYGRLGQREAAAEHLVRAIRLDPKSPELYRALSRLYVEQGRVDLAIVALRDGLEAAETWPMLRRVELAEELAALYERAGMSREAERERARVAAWRAS
jgi:tetratricopeptide (TPR) repeat protein